MGAPSLSASLALHGAAIASLVLTISVPWLTDDEGSRETIQTQLAFEQPQPSIEPDPAPEDPSELPEALTPADVPEPEAWEVPATTAPDPFPEFFGAEAELEMSVVMPAFELDPKRILRDPELPQEDAPTESEPTPEAKAVDEAVEPAETSPEKPVEEPAETASEPIEDEGPPSILSPSPIPSECPPPAYPRVAERRGWTGTVVLLIDVNAKGLVTGVTVESTSGHDVLDDAAVNAVRTWRFRPGTLNGSAAPLVVRKPIRFGL